MFPQPDLFGWHKDEEKSVATTVTHKQCSTCEVTKEITEFPVFQARVAMTCTAEGTRRSNPLPKDFRCPICNSSAEDFTSTGRYLKQRPFAVDHDHKANKVRGWVCCSCNSAMGYIKDDIEAATKMIDFLKRSKDA
jgi:transcription elongation factor Elf1